MKLALARLLFLIATASLFVVQAQTPAGKEIKRPAIVGVSHIGLNVADLEAARGFYKGILGFDEAYGQNNPDSNLKFTDFKVNDHQYVQIFPGLASPTADRLNHVCFETADAEQLRAYLASKGVEGVPAKVGEMGGGNLGFEVHDPDGHLVEFVEYRPGGWDTKIRVSDGAILGTFPVGACPGPIAFDGHSIWIASFANSPSPTLTKLRPTDGAILETYFGGGFGPEGIVFDGASIWVTSPFGDSVSKF